MGTGHLDILPEATIAASGSMSVRTGEAHFDSQFRLTPEKAELWNSYGCWLLEQNRSDEARKAFARAMDLDETYPHAVGNLAMRLWLDGSDVNESERLFVRAMELTEPSPPSWLLSNRGLFLAEAMGDVDAGLEMQDRANPEGRYPLAAVRKAELLAKHRGDTDLAKSLMIEALDAGGINQPQVLYMAAKIAYFQLGDLASARTWTERAISLGSKDRAILRLHADLSLQAGDAAIAIPYYRRLIRSYEKVGKPVPADARGNFGLALLIADKPDGALRHLGRTIKSDPTSPTIRTNHAATLYRLGRIEGASAGMDAVLSAGAPPCIELEVSAMLVLATCWKVGHARSMRRVCRCVLPSPLTEVTLSGEVIGPASGHTAVADDLAFRSICSARPASSEPNDVWVAPSSGGRTVTIV